MIMPKNLRMPNLRHCAICFIVLSDTDPEREDVGDGICRYCKERNNSLPEWVTCLGCGQGRVATGGLCANCLPADNVERKRTRTNVRDRLCAKCGAAYRGAETTCSEICRREAAVEKMAAIRQKDRLCVACGTAYRGTKITCSDACAEARAKQRAKQRWLAEKARWDV